MVGQHRELAGLGREGLVVRAHVVRVGRRQREHGRRAGVGRGADQPRGALVIEVPAADDDRGAAVEGLHRRGAQLEALVDVERPRLARRPRDDDRRDAALDEVDGVLDGLLDEQATVVVEERDEGDAGAGEEGSGHGGNGTRESGHDHRVHPEDRYDDMPYRRCGHSGLRLPGRIARPVAELRRRRPLDTSAQSSAAHSTWASPTSTWPTTTVRPPAPPRRTSAAILSDDLRPYRDELVISTKAGLRLSPGPYGEWGSRKYLLASLDQSLKRMGLDYVDIFYSHRLDPDDAARGDDDGPRPGGPPGQGALRRHLHLRAGRTERPRDPP